MKISQRKKSFFIYVGEKIYKYYEFPRIHHVYSFFHVIKKA